MFRRAGECSAASAARAHTQAVPNIAAPVQGSILAVMRDLLKIHGGVDTPTQNIENQKKQVLTFIKERTYTASTEIKRRNFRTSSLLILDAAEKSVVEINDPRSKTRLFNKISEARFNMGDKESALNTIINSLNFADKMHVDLPKKIMHLSKIYEILYLLGENEKYKSI